jgi:hypothetical protein
MTRRIIWFGWFELFNCYAYELEFDGGRSKVSRCYIAVGSMEGNATGYDYEEQL